MKLENLEKHGFLPSGDWEGFYCYRSSPKQHKMVIKLTFKKNKVSGSGIDDVAPFNWKGTYALDSLKAKLIKRYATHKILYHGDIDENGIWGMWNCPIPANLVHQFTPQIIEYMKEQNSGGFHIWPKKSKQKSKEEEMEENVTESKKLKKLFTTIS